MNDTVLGPLPLLEPTELPIGRVYVPKKAWTLFEVEGGQGRVTLNQDCHSVIFDWDNFEESPYDAYEQVLLWTHGMAPEDELTVLRYLVIEGQARLGEDYARRTGLRLESHIARLEAQINGGQKEDS